MQVSSSIPDFWKPVIPNMHRRCKMHDYYAPCIYLITMRSNRVYGRLSNLSGNLEIPNSTVKTIPTEIGNIIFKNLFDLKRRFPNISILNRVIMPDHIHFIIYIRKRTELSLSDYISSFMGSCSRAVWEAFPKLEPSVKKIGIFEKGFNDKILWKNGQLARFHHYINFNPRRLMMRLSRPEYFFNKTGIIIEGESHDAFGNFDLLLHPVMEPVIVSSKYTEEERNRHYDKWREVVREGGVLVGAFIHPEEAKIKQRALEYGAKIIQIVDYGFADKYKPKEKDERYCAEGRILYLAFKAYTTRKTSLSKSFCYAMNDLARKIANFLPPVGTPNADPTP